MIEFNIIAVTRDTVLKMLIYEQELRYSKEVQTVYTEQYIASKNPKYNPIKIEREIQKYVLTHFGFNDSDTSLKEYWKIPSTYWNDEEVKNSIFYMKLNIFQYSNVNTLVDTTLVDYNTNTEVALSSLQNTGKPLILLAGSMT